MTNSSDESDTGEQADVGISDDKLPEDLVPGDDNPLAEPLDPEEADDDLLAGGKIADEMDADDDSEADGSEADAEV